jgi:hypothetical protein
MGRRVLRAGIVAAAVAMGCIAAAACGSDGSGGGTIVPDATTEDVAPDRFVPIDSGGGDDADTSDASDASDAGDASNDAPSEGGPYDTLATGLTDPYGVALDDAYVYVTVYGDKTVRRIPKAGGTATPIGSSTSLYWGIAVANGVVYWATQGNVARVLVDGGSAGLPLGSGTQVTGVAIDDTTVYFSNYTGQGVYSTLLDGGAGAQWDTMSTTFRVVVDATHVYFGEGNTVRFAPKNVSTATLLTTGTSFVDGIAVDATNVYFTDRTAGIVYRADKTTPGAATIVTQGWNMPGGIVVDGAYLYFTEYVSTSPGGRIVKVRADGAGSPVIVAGGQIGPFTIAVDATHVYWATYENAGTVRRAVK